MLARVLRAAGFACGALGAIWLFQGLGLLPGSVMTGQAVWAVAGGALLVLGLVLYGVGATRR